MVGPFKVMITCAIFALATTAANAERASRVPPEFVYLRQIDPSIIQDIRYATPINFTGHKVPGYAGAECILLHETALALKAVQDALRDLQLSLKVYDCYRPQRAVLHFVHWAKDPTAQGIKRYYPRTLRADLLKLGYIAAVSSHTKGTAVDASIVALPRKKSVQPDPTTTYGPCIAPQREREADESLDMGTSFDCFDENSRNPKVVAELLTAAANEAAAKAQQKANSAPLPPTHTSQGPVPPAPPLPPIDASTLVDITADQRSLRGKLNDIMVQHGFKGISAEWWHYSFVGIRRPLPPQDFVIQSSPRAP